MAEKITREDGTEVELFTAEELEQQKAEAIEKVRSEASGALNKLEEDKTHLVEELKELRKKREPQPNPADNKGKNEEVELAVKRALEAKEQERGERNKELAVELFKQNNKEFHPDNDPGGLKFKKLSDEFNLYRTDNLREVADFTKFLDKAKGVVSPDQSKVETVNLDPSVPNPRSPKGKDENKLSSEEQKFVKQAGWTDERYLKLKEKQPEYVAKLLKQASQVTV